MHWSSFTWTCIISGPVNEYPTMHYFGIPRHTASMILTEYFWKLQLKNCMVGILWACPRKERTTYRTELLVIRATIGTVLSKAVRFWSCPLCRNRCRIIPFRPCMPKWAQTCGKILSQVGLGPTTSCLLGWCSTYWATAPDVQIGDNCGMLPKCGYAVYSQ